MAYAAASLLGVVLAGCQGPQPTTSPASAPDGSAAPGMTVAPVIGKTVQKPAPSPPRPAPNPYQGSTDPVVHMKPEPNVLNVAAYYAPYNPWVWTDDRAKVKGIAINALYLGGPEVLGVFGDGVIRPRLYVLEADEKGGQQPRLAVEWAFDVMQAMPFRSKKRTAMGYGYGMRLLWSDDLDLSGKDIRMTVSFERRDGRMVHSGKKDFKVPTVSPP